MGVRLPRIRPVDYASSHMGTRQPARVFSTYGRGRAILASVERAGTGVLAVVKWVFAFPRTWRGIIGRLNVHGKWRSVRHCDLHVLHGHRPLHEGASLRSQGTAEPEDAARPHAVFQAGKLVYRAG